MSQHYHSSASFWRGGGGRAAPPAHAGFPLFLPPLLLSSLSSPVLSCSPPLRHGLDVALAPSTLDSGSSPRSSSLLRLVVALVAGRPTSSFLVVHGSRRSRPDSSRHGRTRRCRSSSDPGHVVDQEGLPRVAQWRGRSLPQGPPGQDKLDRRHRQSTRPLTVQWSPCAPCVSSLSAGAPRAARRPRTHLQPPRGGALRSRAPIPRSRAHRGVTRRHA